MKTHYLLNLVLVLAAIAVGMFLFMGTGGNNAGGAIGGKGATKIIPRNAQPMGTGTAAFEKFQIPVNGLSYYTYYWREPPQPWPENVKFPLVLVLHGAPGNAYAANFLASEAASYKYPAFLLVPVLGRGTYWAMPAKVSGTKGNVLDSRYALTDIVAMIDIIATQYPVDKSRIYVIGCSDGGTGVFGAARYFPDFFAAGVALGGSWDPEDGVNMTGMPLWIQHGRLDEIMPAEQVRALADIIKSRGGAAHYTEFESLGHNCPSPLFYSNATWEWMFARKRP